MTRELKVYSGWILQRSWEISDLNDRELRDFERHIADSMPDGWHIVVDDEDEDDWPDAANWSAA